RPIRGKLRFRQPLAQVFQSLLLGGGIGFDALESFRRLRQQVHDEASLVCLRCLRWYCIALEGPGECKNGRGAALPACRFTLASMSERESASKQRGFTAVLLSQAAAE